MARYKVICHDCNEEWTYDDDDVPDFANPAKNPHIYGDSVEDAEWDAYSAAQGKRDGHATDSGLEPPYESHEVEILEINL